ncbi:M24 family metallopeptidase [Campylobacter ureolyticus]|uniref:Xaa-Pro dipeptidase, M24 metallopeptidase family n=1 Tax=Campylobacter ureolyticus TaxID=827 RepID=A0AAE7JP26_9BACT|nr:M24 family metallopeptidase [Campylobacter ureolyticus]MCR8684150.1 M24 family metallopeptidase [Campylobacter ureolyticus]QKF83803.1 Xaa-Pro dipeptidase, M24 metallopeptidase family [Campylobacter ureolyticus]QQY36043.1 M24 family metallopeptidase [Campylobacter ureolyticus]SUX24725.1 Xaa-Pro peptidase [Campylobacter ureolyticus]
MNNYILKDENAVFYECGYSCDNEIFLSINGNNFFITDSRYAIEARNLVKNAEVIDAKNPLIKEARLLIRKFGIKSLVFDPNDFTYADFKKISSNLSLNFISKPFFSKKKRIIKTDFEIEILKKAANLGAKYFDEFALFLNKNGENLSEFELFYEAEKIFKQKGVLGLSFSPIIALNKNAAKAHALPSSDILNFNDLLLLDAGVKYKRYCSDRTRTAIFNKNLNFSKEQIFNSNKQNEIYEIVKEAQSLAIKAVKPGVMACDVDKAAREFIKKQCFEKEFFHSTGHGVGVDIHEFPNINKTDKTILKEGMVFSVEPGIYLENEFGIRIEDVVVVTENGCEIL